MTILRSRLPLHLQPRKTRSLPFWLLPALATLVFTIPVSTPAQTPAQIQTTPHTHTKPSPNNAAAPAGYTSVSLLWPSAVPGAVGAEPQDIPRLYAYPASGPGPHTAVIVLPGGGYHHLVWEKEGATEARWLNQHGVSAFVLQYRLSPRYRYPWPLLDGQRALRLVRSHAEAWHLRPNAIGVWGFSAGGHLAGFLATAEGPVTPDPHPDAVDATSAHPDFAIISYGRLSLDPAIPGTFGMKSLTGDNPPQSLVDKLSPVLHVNAGTSPSFIYSTEGDKTVSSLNATAFYDALYRAGVPAELHVFEFGPHGTGMGQNLAKEPELAIWPLLLAHWMQAHGWMEPSPETAPQ